MRQLRKQACQLYSAVYLYCFFHKAVNYVFQTVKRFFNFIQTSCVSNLICNKYNKYFVIFVCLVDFYEIVCKKIVLLIVSEMLINIYFSDIHSRLYYLYNSILFIDNQTDFESKLVFNFFYKFAVFRTIVDLSFTTAAVKQYDQMQNQFCA